MKKLPKKLILPLLLLVFLVIPVSVFAAGSFASTTVSRTQVVTGDYITAGDKVTISGRVDGDAIVAGGSIFVDGVIRGDLIAAGGTVTVNGEVDQDIRVIGGTVNINGRVGRNISFAGGTVQIGREAVLGGSVAGAFGQLQYFGQALSDLNLVGGSVDMDGRTDGNIYLRADSVSFGDNAQVMGNLTYESRREAEIAPGAHIFGTTTYKPVMGGGQSYSQAKAGWNGIKQGFSIVGLLVAYLIGFVLLRVFPRRMDHMKEIMLQSPGKSILIGLLFVMITPLSILLLFITLVGIPLAIIWLFAVVIMIYFAKIVIGYPLGLVILKKLKLGERRGWALLTGLVVFFLLRNFPFVGWLFSLLVLFAGLGIMVREKIYIYRRIVARKIL